MMRLVNSVKYLNNVLKFSNSWATAGTRNISQTIQRNFPIKSAKIISEKEQIQINFDNGKSYEYPWVFLQDNCTCPKCFHHSSQSRLRKIYDLQLHNPIIKVELDNTQTNVTCTWADNHRAKFQENWLLQRNFSKENVQRRTTVTRENPKFVGADYHIESDKFEVVLTDDSRLLRLLKILCEYGIFKLEGAPKEFGQLKRLADKIGFMRLTHYGNEFTVISKPNASNPAYTSEKLGLHMDLPYYVYPPGVQLLHCIKQYKGTDGGHSHIVDGFYVAHQIKKEFPYMYEALSNTTVEFTDIGEDYIKFYKIHHSPIFVHSQNSGKLTRIVYSNQQLSSNLPISIEKVKPFYEAMKLFSTVCYEPKNLMQFKLEEGEILVFDNWRMLHGREGFDPSKGERYLEGCYIDWDEISSKMRLLSRSVKSEIENTN